MPQRPISEWRIPLVLILVLLLALGFLARRWVTVADGWWGASARATGTPALLLGQALVDSGQSAQAELVSPEALSALRAELAEARAELELTRQELADWREGRAAGRGGMTFDIPREFRMLAADVVGFQPQPRRQSVVMNRGRRHGVQPDMPVITEAGLLGVVRKVDDASCIVQLLTDPFFAAGAEASGEGWQAAVLGRGADAPLLVEPTEPVHHVRDGSVLVTSGVHGSLFPRGIPIGTLRRGSTNRLGIAPLTLEPAADPDSRFALIMLGW